MTEIVSYKGTDTFFGESFSEKCGKLIYTIESDPPRHWSLAPIEAKNKFGYRIKNDPEFEPVAKWIRDSLKIEVISDQTRVPGRQGIQFQIILGISHDAQDIIEYLDLAVSDHGFYQQRYEPGKYNVEMFSDSWGHQNNKMIFFTRLPD